MYKINFSKWYTAVQAAKGDQAKITLLYSIRAHGRGRIHRRVAGLTWYDWTQLPANKSKTRIDLQSQKPAFTNNDGKLTLILELEDQAAYIGERYKEFLKAEAVAA